MNTPEDDDITLSQVSGEIPELTAILKRAAVVLQSTFAQPVDGRVVGFALVCYQSPELRQDQIVLGITNTDDDVAAAHVRQWADSLDRRNRGKEN